MIEMLSIKEIEGAASFAIDGDVLDEIRAEALKARRRKPLADGQRPGVTVTWETALMLCVLARVGLRHASYQEVPW